METCPFYNPNNDADDVASILQEYFLRPDDDSSQSELSDSDDTENEYDENVEVGNKCLPGYLPFTAPDKDDYAVETDDESHLITQFFQRICPCRRHKPPLPCVTAFTMDEIRLMRAECKALDYHENHVNRLDLVISSQLRALTSTGSNIRSTKKHDKERERVRSTFLVKGHAVCKSTFLFVHAISEKRFRKIQTVYLWEGLVEKTHGNAKRLPYRSLTHEETKHVVDCIRNYAQQNALFLPGRQAGQFNSSVKLLPTSDTKKNIYADVYQTSCQAAEIPSVALTTFRKIWNTFCREIVISKPKWDLCKFCQKHFTSVNRQVLLDENEKKAIAAEMTKHLNNVSDERKFYNDTIAATKWNLNKFKVDEQNKGNTVEFIPTLPNSYVGSGHHSFDMAQLVSLPHNPYQPGPIYFMTGFKVCIFGVMNDTMQQQYNYLIPESMSISKSASYIVSMLDHYFQRFTIGESTLNLHADNCCWQNKNFTLMSYLNYRILSGMNQNITISYMPPGHTKFSCDWAFGLFKKKYRITEAYTLEHVKDIVEKSTPQTQVNQCVLTSDERGIEFKVDFHKWNEFFEAMSWKKIPKITSFYHFEFSHERPGIVRCKEDLNAEVKEYEIGLALDPNLTLSKEESSGLSLERQKYLFENLREYVPTPYKDTLCPSPKQGTESQASVVPVETQSGDGDAVIVSGPKKRGRPRKVQDETAEKSKGPKTVVKRILPPVQKESGDGNTVPVAKKRGRPKKVQPVTKKNPKSKIVKL